MMIPVSQVRNGVANYIDAEIMSKVPAGTLKRFAIGTAVAVMMKRAEQAVQPYIEGEMLKAFGVTDGECVDIDILTDSAREAMPDCGVCVKFMGIDMRFCRDDVDVVRHYVMNAPC